MLKVSQFKAKLFLFCFNFCVSSLLTSNYLIVFFPKIIVVLCLIFAIVYGQISEDKINESSDLEGAESANPQWGRGKPKIIFFIFMI